MLKKTMLYRIFRRAFIRTAAICLIANSLLCSAAFAGEIVDRVVAVINEDVITLSELEAEAMPAYEKIRQEAPSSQVDEAMKNAQRDILRGMIDHKLLIQRAAKRNIEVSSAEIEGAINRILEQNSITVEQFRQQLASMGLAEEKYRESLRDQILRSKLIGYEIRSKVVITNEQIDAYYRDHYSKNNNPEGYHILQFGSGWNDNGGRSASREEAQKRAEQLREMVRAGENFKDIAKNHSDLPSAVDGGDIGTFTKAELADYMWLAIRDLRPGEVSNIIETPSGFQFFRLLSSSSDGVITQAPLENVREEIRATLYDQELKRKFELWVKELRENSYIEELL
ncbi:MAG: SurA N-terminal domain-containing protein [Deltaproteobacteria bacterium]|nr:SurA N-terminal domain-containing protein [Deltaproteobacteria bacterium]